MKLTNKSTVAASTSIIVKTVLFQTLNRSHVLINMYTHILPDSLISPLPALFHLETLIYFVANLIAQQYVCMYVCTYTYARNLTF
jgi:hypothetical protein